MKSLELVQETTDNNRSCAAGAALAAEEEEQDEEESTATREALRDLYGYAGGEQPQPRQPQQQQREGIQDALSKLRGALKEAYDRVLERAPELIEQESNPDRFVEAHYNKNKNTNKEKKDKNSSNQDNNDCFSVVARSIALYWQKRFEVFGTERACLPMKQTNGKGVLSQDALDSFRYGCTCVLPPDEHNRPVLFVDCTRLPQQQQQQQPSQSHVVLMEQLLFYNMHILFDSELARNNGIVVLLRMENHNNNNDTASCQQQTKNLLALLQSGAVPLQVKSLHTVVLQNHKTILENMIPNLLAYLFHNYKHLRRRTVIHVAKNSQTVFRNHLESYGFLPERLPNSLGGTLEYDRHVRQAMQRQNPLSNHNNNSQQDCDATTGSGGGASQSSSQTQNQEKKRLTDILYHRQKRMRNKQHELQLKEQVDLQREQNWALQAEHERLKMAWESAVDIVQKQTCDHQQQQHQDQQQQQHQQKAPVATSPVLPTTVATAFPTSSFPPPAAAVATTGASGAVHPQQASFPQAAATHYPPQPAPPQHNMTQVAATTTLLDRLLLAGINPAQLAQNWSTVVVTPVAPMPFTDQLYWQNFSAHHHQQQYQEQALQQLLRQQESVLGHHQRHQQDEAALAHLLHPNHQPQPLWNHNHSNHNHRNTAPTSAANLSLFGSARCTSQQQQQQQEQQQQFPHKPCNEVPILHKSDQPPQQQPQQGRCSLQEPQHFPRPQE